MRKLVVCWILIGCVGYFILPWYVVDDGFFSIEFFQYYSLEDYGPAIILFFLDDKIWLLPLLFFLLVPVVFFFKKTNNSIYSNLFIFIGLLGLIYFFFQGFSIGLRGWHAGKLANSAASEALTSVLILVQHFQLLLNTHHLPFERHSN